MHQNIFLRLGQTIHRRIISKRRESIVKIVDRIALILVIIGALNWGSVGLFAFDCVAFICGGQLSTLSRIIYALVGIAGLWCITLLFRDSEECT